MRFGSLTNTQMMPRHPRARYKDFAEPKPACSWSPLEVLDAEVFDDTQPILTPGLEFAALVGIDWADQKHDVCLLDVATQEQQHFVLTHTPEAIDDWAAELRQRFGGRLVGICLEQSRGVWCTL